MTDEKDTNNQNLVHKLIAVLLRLPWTHVLGDAWKALRKAIHGRSYRGLYEVSDYESTFELKDRKGKRATVWKREKVRYLQDNVIAYQGQAWGDGEILPNYRCAPGMPVDRYLSGHETYIRTSRREVKDKGDVDEFNIKWDIRQGFLRQAEQWETHVTHRTKRLKFSLVFPRSRPSRHTVLIEGNRRRSHDLGASIQVLPEGHWLVTEAHKENNGAQQGSPPPIEPSASAKPCEHMAS